MSETRTYTASDIERYHKGAMSPAEMHLLEKAALDDPALADMLEGYAYAPTPAADLETLQLKLQQRIEKESKQKTVAFPLQWLKVAAILVFLAGAGWLFFQTGTKEKNETAKVNATEVAKEKLEQAGVKTDSSSTIGKTATASAPADSSHTTSAVVINNRRSREENKNVYSYKKALANKASGAAISQSAADSTAVTGLIKETEKANRSASGNVALLDKATAAAPPSAGYVNTDTVKNLNITMKRLDRPVEEVVIKKSKQELRARKPIVEIDSLEPERGWNYFDDYIAENVKTPAELAKKTSDDREVELSFRTDSEGNPTNIKVTKSLCDKCDAEAIRLLKEGPKWKGKKGKVKIKFPMSP